MKRRQFLQAAGVGLAATAVAKPAIAQSMPEIKWRLSSGFPKSLDTIYGGAEMIAKYVGEATDGKFQIQPFAAGEIVGTFQVADAVGNGTVEMGQTASYYYVGKDPTFAFATAIPFGLNPRMENAWLYHGGGIDLLNEFFAKHNLYGMPAGNTGAQMGGWFRKEIKTVADLQGLKMRIGGLAGQVLAKLGVVPQQIPAATSTRRSSAARSTPPSGSAPTTTRSSASTRSRRTTTIPASGRAAPRSRPSSTSRNGTSCRRPTRACSTAACGYANVDMLAKYDARNPAALRRLVGGGAQLRPFPQEILEAGYKAANEVYDELSAKNPDFKKVYERYRAFRNEEYLWFQVAEYTYDNFMIRARARG